MSRIMEQPVEPLICAVCRVLIIDGTHPAELREKFSNVVCDQPQPGRPAKPREAAFGRGDSHRSDKYSLQDQLADIHVSPGTAVALATNGSYKVSQARRGAFDGVSWGYVATNGAYGLGTAVLPVTAIGLKPGTQAELRAIWRGLPRVIGDHPVVLVSNSTRALNLITAWRAGHRPMPSGYDLRPRPSGRKPTLVELADLVEANAARLDILWVRTGSGMPLNEGAHSLARISQAWASRRLTKPQVAADARRVVRRTLAPEAGLAGNGSWQAHVPGKPADPRTAQAAIRS
jgi:ribonuclease HI